MNKKHLWLGLSVLLALVMKTGWAADQGDQVVTEVLDDRWFVTPHIGLVFSDQGDFDNGPGFGVSIGKPFNENFAYEFTLTDQKIKTSHAGDYKRDSLSAQALWFFLNTPFLDSGGSFHPYLLGGVQASKIKFLGENPGGYGPIAALGLMEDFGRIRLRLEARYQLDYVNKKGSILQNDSFYTWYANLGVELPLGKKPQPPSYDDDNDGVPNNRDKCPNTPPGVKVGTDGCPLDSDGDGVPDTYDKCPNTPKGVIVNADGCPLDSDGDGVPDGRDKCPNTPKGVIVNADGCPLDSDGDGVPDGLDQCPNTLPGVKVNSRGCAIPQTVDLRGVHFEFNKAVLLLDSKAILDRVAVSLNSEPDVKVLIAGHTDSIGSEQYNLKLSEARAQSVVEYLVSKGVSKDHLSAKGFGKSQPVVPNTKPDGSDDPDGREHNRRVEMRILDSGQAKD